MASIVGLFLRVNQLQRAVLRTLASSQMDAPVDGEGTIATADFANTLERLESLVEGSGE